MVWHEPALQQLPGDGHRQVFFYVTTGPQATSVGIWRLSFATAAEDMGNLTADEFAERFAVVCDAFGSEFDPIARVVWLPNWLEENPPQSPNVVRNWIKLLNNVPKCRIKSDALEGITQYLREFPETFSKHFESYVQSVSRAKRISKAKPKAYQGSGSRDQGAENSEQDDRGDGTAISDIPFHVHAI